MKQKSTLFLTFFLLLAFTLETQGLTIKNETKATDSSYISFRKTWIDFNKSQQTTRLAVESNLENWSAATEESWIAVEEDDWSQNDTLVVTLSANNTGGSRFGNIVLSGGELTDTVEVKQLSTRYFNENKPTGINLNGINDWSTEIVWKDLTKRARGWMGLDQISNQNVLPPSDVDSLGYLKGGVTGQAIINGSNSTPLRGGKYILLYKGKGEIEVTKADLVKQEPGKKVYNIEPQTKFQIRITENDENNPLHDIHLFHKDFEDSWQSEPFHPKFLDNWKYMKVIRFMDWMHTNGSVMSTWDDMRPKDYFSQGMDQEFREEDPPSVAIEWMIELCNTLHADPWFCMPHKATDNFVRTFASKVRKNLDPDLNIYVEYSNETWNWSFDQCYYMVEKGKEMNLDDNDSYANFKYYGYRSSQIMDIWYDVFKGETDRLVRLLNVQAGFSRSADSSAAFRDTYQHVDALSIAPYWGRQLGFPEGDYSPPPAADMTKEEIMDDLYYIIVGKENVTNKSNVEQITKNYEVAKKFDLRLTAYEGGQHLVGRANKNKKWDQILAPKFHDINRHPRMYDLYKKSYEVWRELGGTLYAAFASCGSWTNFGSWGLMEYMTQPPEEAPKYKATIDWAKNNPIWWANDENPPTAPSNLQVLSRQDSILEIGWDASTDDSKVVKYDVYLDDEFYGAAVASVEGTSYTIDGINPENSYEIYLIARDSALNTSIHSKVLHSEPGTSYVEQPKYTVGLNSNGSGSVTITPDKTEYLAGEEVTIKATPAENYFFEGWTENGSKISEDTTYSFTVLQDTSITANFSAGHTVSLSSDPSDAGSVTGEGTYRAGTEVTVSAVAHSGYVFDGWTEEDTVVTENMSYTFSIDSDRTLKANFNPKYAVKLSSEPSEGGNVSGGGSYEAGKEITIAAAANQGYVFDYWMESDTVVSEEENYTLTVTSNREFTARFTPEYKVNLSAEPSAGGSVSGEGSYLENTEVTVSATVSDGYVFDGWWESDTLITDSLEYTFNIFSERNLNARFNPEYTISLSVNPSEGGSVSGEGTYEDSTELTVSATPANGYTFDNWIENDTVASSDSNYTFIVTGDRILTANFSVISSIGNVSYKNGNIRIYPNPAEDKANIEKEGINNNVKRITIYNSAGTPIKILDDGEINSGPTEIDLSSFGSGTYFIHFRLKDQTVTEKLIVR